MEKKFFDRDLSWLNFNERVLMEALDQKVPLVERLRFLAIYSSNLDEFFRVRVADLRSIAGIDKKAINKEVGIKPNKLLAKIHEQVSLQLDEYGKALTTVLEGLKENGIELQKTETYRAEHAKTVLYFFKTKVLGLLQPQYIKKRKEIFLNNRELYLALHLKSMETGKEKYAFVNIPSDKITRFLPLPAIDGQSYFTYLDDVVRAHLDMVFPGNEVLECVSIKLNKDADLHIEDEFSGDLVDKIEQQIQKRNLGTPSRFLIDGTASEDMVEVFRSVLALTENDVVKGGRYHNLHDFWTLPVPKKQGMEYEKTGIINKATLDESRSIFAAIDTKDQLLHFPFHAYDHVLQFFNEAAADPDVERIQVTFYRMAKNSMIGEALISAAINGKSVTVFMELKARFDEANNLKWAAKMKAAGIKIIYSIPGLKVHAKVALVTKKLKGKIIRYGFFGTGNLNEQTARIYVDHGLLTRHQGMTDELAQVFAFLERKKKPEKLEHLLVSQFNIVESFYKMIDHEIENQKAGKPSGITVKLNNLEEPGMIGKLYEASEAGVKVNLIVRSICCLIPGKKFSENITVTRIVDRYLEHGRIFLFHNDGQETVFMGSADWMKRNLYRRVEVVFPIYDAELRDEIKEIINLQLADNTKAVILDSKNQNIRKKTDEKKPVRAQVATYEYLKSAHQL